MPAPQSKRWYLFAVALAVGSIVVIGGGVFVIQRLAGHQPRVRAARASMVMPMAQAYQLTNNRWPSKPTDLAPAFMSPTGAAAMERDGFEFVTGSDGGFVIKWDDRGVKRTMDMKRQVSPPLP